MTTPLIPEQRIDKNGRVVIRHVKAGGAATGAGRSIPAPKSITAPSKGTRREKLISSVTELVVGDNALATRRASLSAETVATKLKKFKDDAVITAVGEAMSDPERARYVGSILKDSFLYDEEPENYLKLVVGVDQMFVEIEKYGEQMPKSMYSDIPNLYSSMGFKERDFRGPVTDEHLEYFKAHLLASKIGLHDSGYPIKALYYRQIESIRENLDVIQEALPVIVCSLRRDYYKNNWDGIVEVMDKVKASGNTAVDIANVMMERGTKDFDLVNEVLNNGVKAVSSGVL